MLAVLVVGGATREYTKDIQASSRNSTRFFFKSERDVPPLFEQLHYFDCFGAMTKRPSRAKMPQWENRVILKTQSGGAKRVTVFALTYIVNPDDVRCVYLIICLLLIKYFMQ
jgi:hypothetical protein